MIATAYEAGIAVNGVAPEHASMGPSVGLASPGADPVTVEAEPGPCRSGGEGWAMCYVVCWGGDDKVKANSTAKSGESGWQRDKSAQPCNGIG